MRGVGWDHERCMGPLRASLEPWRGRGGQALDWEARSLRAFGDQPVEELAPHFDLLSIDHPCVGTVAQLGCLAPLDELLPAEVVRDLAADAIGASHRSYEWGGHLWGLATDAACQVAAVRDDLLAGRTAPTTWEGVLELARALPGQVAIPLVPADAISSFLTLCANAGAPPPESPVRFADPGAGLRALAFLAELVPLAHPESLDLNPIGVFDRMSSGDEIAYVPLAYGYTNYARASERPHRLRFLDIPSAGAGPIGSILGGAGLAVSATSPEPAAAAAYAAWITGAEAQQTIVTRSGGQPGSRSCWLDPELDASVGGFFSGTLRTVEAAYVRPRDAWWPPLQLAAGAAINEGLRTRVPARELLAEVERLYRSAVEEDRS